ncbi:DUF6680 family protein [Pseudomonas sp. TH31]|uniref:DUF6680 family protein n=1 Tax=Pseudomonas sp. TH31 TaxID=2796396 RepID=UPI001913DB44|nr:DUF6680 family protein [Pseudomonas sp. TH31]MBK5415242.1 hypothetical protein [Pseudomonas sp. TH31]
MAQILNLELKDWATIVAALMGPILAVQAQKLVERFREHRNRKNKVFEQLMATRSARVSPDHVRALNMIDLVFYGEKTVGIQRRSKTEQSVLNAWKEYLDHLNNKLGEDQAQLWMTTGDELFTNLLYAMAEDIGFKFDRVQLKRGSYSPIAHVDFEAEQAELRRATLSLITGKHALKMDVIGFPFDEDAAEAHKKAVQNVGNALETGKFRVQLLPQEQE